MYSGGDILDVQWWGYTECTVVGIYWMYSGGDILDACTVVGDILDVQWW